MTDLVERLRELNDVDKHKELCGEAADEIERLEQRLELALGASRNPEDIAEIERLRDILYEIAHMDPIRRIQGDAQRVAKKALENKE